MNNTVQETIKWWNIFNQENISISGKTTNFKIKINDNSLPHLLGIQYINENYKVARGKDLLNYVSKNRLSDEKNRSNFLNKPEDLKQYFDSYFLKNIKILKQDDKHKSAASVKRSSLLARIQKKKQLLAE